MIKDIFSDDEASDLDFALINSLGIDMDWKHKFFLDDSSEKDLSITSEVSYEHENVGWHTYISLYNLKFNNNQNVSSMEVIATLNNYDIIKELGEDKIKQTVKEAFTKWAKGEEGSYNGVIYKK